MVIESFNDREKRLPSSDITQIDVKRYQVRDFVDDAGIAHSSVQEVDELGFLDVPFRDFSMTTMVATGEVSRLHFVTPQSDTSLDSFDRVTGDLSEISAKIDHFEAMQAAASSAGEVSSESK